MRVNPSVLVLEREDFARLHLVPLTRALRRNNANLTILIGVTAAHAAALYLVAAFPSEIAHPVETDSLVVVNIRPRIVVSRLPTVPPPPIRLPKDIPIAVDLPIPDFAQPTLAVLGVGTMPPRPDELAIDPAPFARRAGLATGQGATVVLRVEVLGSGDIGRIEIDVSGGTPEIDREAIAYATALQWVGGMVDGQPASMWIRWGVRLQA